MSFTVSRIAVTGLAFVLIFISGLWLSNSSKPYNTLLLTVHKLIAVGAVIFLGVTIRTLHQDVSLNALEIGLIVLAALLFVATIGTGGALSTAGTMPALVKTLHHIAPYLTALSTVGALYMLLDRR